MTLKPRPRSRKDLMSELFVADLAADAIIGTSGIRMPAMKQEIWMYLILPDASNDLAWNGNWIFQNREAVWNSHQTVNCIRVYVNTMPAIDSDIGGIKCVQRKKVGNNREGDHQTDTCKNMQQALYGDTSTNHENGNLFSVNLPVQGPCNCYC